VFLALAAHCRTNKSRYPILKATIGTFCYSAVVCLHFPRLWFCHFVRHCACIVVIIIWFYYFTAL